MQQQPKKGNIATLTLNPAVDISYRVKQLVPDGKVKSTESRYDPGGNGVNVSRSLKLLGEDAYTCCAIAGETGQFFRMLVEKQIGHLVALSVAGATRINCAVQQRRPPQEFKISGNGPKLTAGDLEYITARFLELADKGVGVLTGSLPEGIDDSVYHRLGEKLRDENAKVVIDAKSEILEAAMDVHPYLIKPSRTELERMGGRTLPSVTALAEQTRELQKRGVENICLSLGQEGAIFINGENSYYGTAPKIYPICSTGAGDAMLAGVLTALINDKPAEEVLSLGLACGSGTTAREGTELFDPDKLEDYQQDVEVTVLDI